MFSFLVCFHTDKRKVMTSDGKQALIHKYSVNCGRPGEIQKFISPFFVFGEKIKTRAVAAVCMTMVTPLQLLLFASEKIETVPDDKTLICLDNWINLKIELELASMIVTVISAINSIIATCTMDPNIISNPSPHILSFINTFKMLSDQEKNHVEFFKAEETSINFINTSFSNQQNKQTINRSESTESNFEPASKRFVSNMNQIEPINSTTPSSSQSENDSIPLVGFYIDRQGFNNNKNSIQQSETRSFPPNLMNIETNSNQNEMNRFNQNFNNGFNRGAFRGSFRGSSYRGSNFGYRGNRGSNYRGGNYSNRGNNFQ
jgi:hypothetical protein